MHSHKPQRKSRRHSRQNFWCRHRRDILFVVISLSVLVVIFISPYFYPWLQKTIDGISIGTSDPHLRMDYDGIDVSHYQGQICWDDVAADNEVRFVYVKATEGSDITDSMFHYNMSEANRTKIPVGAYHFLTSHSPIRKQFCHFVSTTSMYHQDLLPMIDIERSGVNTWNKKQIRDSLKLFADLLTRHFGCQPLIYTYSSFYKAHLSPLFDSYKLFLARYSSDPPLSTDSIKYHLWQHSDQGLVDGIPRPVDIDLFAPGASLKDILIDSCARKRFKRDL